MGRSLLRRSVTLAAAAGLWVGSVAVPAEAGTDRAASTGQISDPTGDAEGLRTVVVQEPRADITGAKAIRHSDGRIELTVSLVQPTNPASDPGWADGGSGLMWLIDTTSDDIPEYMVMRGVFPEGSTVVAHADTADPVDGCSPVTDYSTARHSVTVPASCLGSPTTFRWNVAMFYDADHSDESDAVMDSVPGGFLEQMTAGPGTVTDPTGDVTATTTTSDARADLTGASAAYDTGRITLTAAVASPTDPRVDAAWAGENSGVTWALDTGGDANPEFYVDLTGRDLVVRVYDASSLDIICSGSGTYGPAGYSAEVDPSCIGSPAAFMWAVAMGYDEGSGGVFDFAPEYPETAGPVNAPGSNSDPDPEPDPGVRTSGGQSGYWMITDTGDVFGFGDAHHFGNDAGAAVKRVDIEPTRSGNGYWVLAASGAVAGKGDARLFGDASGRLQPGEQAAALSATPSGAGYWIFTDRGRVLPFGDAPFLGDMTGVKLNGAVLDSVATPSGQGYWMVGSDGGIFAFGDATFHGSTGNIRLNKPVMSMAADPDGKGYWLVASDGGIFAFDAPFYGSMGATKLNKPISGMVPGDAGYLMVAEDGGIFAFGNVAFHGSLGAKPPANPVIAVALTPRAR